MNDFTNFHTYSHADMRKMVQAMDSGGVMAASDPWRKAAQTLKDIRAALNTASLDATSSWEGNTSDAFLAKMSSLANTVNNASAYANDAAVSLQMMSEAIDTAKRDMPEEPGFWDSLGDGAKGFAESAVGMDNATTEMSLADRRKNQAVTVMETLAVKYRAATTYLKPPSPVSFRDDHDSITSDQSPAEAISALIVGGGMGLIGTAQTGSSVSPVSSSAAPRVGRTPQAPRVAVEGPTDSGIKGGTANPAPKPQSPEPIGAGTGIDGVQGGVRTSGRLGGTTGLGDGEGGTAESRGLAGGSNAAAGGYGLNGGGTGGLTGGTLQGGTGIGQARAGLGGRGGAGAFGGGLDGEEAAGAGGQSAMGAARKAGGAAGEAGAAGAGKKGFTEGGSGIGRGRGAGQGAAGQGQGHGMAGGAHGGKNSKKQGKKRPDYLVEDEETWMSGEKVNPDVVE